MNERSFPVLWQCDRKERAELERLGCPRSVPWSVVAPHERRAIKNHDQTLETLARRGGLSPAELLCLLRDEGLRAIRTDPEAVPDLLALIA